MLRISPDNIVFHSKNTIISAEYLSDNFLRSTSLGLFTFIDATIDASKYVMIYLLSVQTMGVFIISLYENMAKVDRI